MKAAVFIQRGAPERKQMSACLDYIDQQHWHLKHVIPYWSPEAAVALVHAGAVEVVVTAFPSKAVTALAAEIGVAGQVVAVHPEPAVIRPPRRLPSVADLVRRLRGRGETTVDIAGYLEIDPEEVRRIGRSGDG